MEIDKKAKIKLAVTGAISGAINGFFGGGGGMALVPLLRGWLRLDARRAFATSVAVMLPMCLVSALAYWLRTGLDLRSAAPFLVGGLLGGVISGLSFKKVPPQLLARAFALLIIYGGVRSVLA